MIRGGPRSRAVSAGAGSFYEVSRATASSIGQPARGMPSNFMLSENRIPGRSGRPPLTPLPGARLPAGNIPDTAAHQVSPRIRLLTRYHPGYGCPPGITPDTAAHQVSPRIRLLTRYRPGYGCSPGITPGTASHQVSPRTDPAPRRGRGRSAAGAGGVGDAGEIRYLERRRQGRGNEFPLPVGPTPRGDIPTVQCTGRSWRKTGHGGPPAPPRIRLLP